MHDYMGRYLLGRLVRCQGRNCENSNEMVATTEVLEKIIQGRIRKAAEEVRLRIGSPIVR